MQKRHLSELSISILTLASALILNELRWLELLVGWLLQVSAASAIILLADVFLVSPLEEALKKIAEQADVFIEPVRQVKEALDKLNPFNW